MSDSATHLGFTNIARVPLVEPETCVRRSYGAALAAGAVMVRPEPAVAPMPGLDEPLRLRLDVMQKTRLQLIVTWLLVAALPSVVAIWTVFTFIVQRQPGDRIGSYALAVGLGATLFSIVSLVLFSAHPERLELLWAAALTALAMAAVAGSLHRTGPDLGGYGTFVGAVGGTIGLLKFLVDRHETARREALEERRRRHDRIVADWQAFVANERLIEAIQILEERGPELKMLGQKLSPKEYKRWKNPLDQILEFLLRLSYSVEARELDADSALHAVGWYFKTVAEEPSLRAYCVCKGYEPVVSFADEHAK